MTKNTLKGYGFAVLSAVIYGTMPLMAKHIYADGVNAMTLVFLRNILALPSLTPRVLIGSALMVAASICIAVSDMRKKEAVSCPKNVI